MGSELDVLVVDNDPDARVLLSSWMKLAGIPVRCANNGAEALECIKEKRPGLVVLDLAMPGMDGFEFLEYVETHPETGDVPIVVLTSRPVDEGLRESLAAPVVEVLRKGTDLAQVESVAERLLRSGSGGKEPVM